MCVFKQLLILLMGFSSFSAALADDVNPLFLKKETVAGLALVANSYFAVVQEMAQLQLKLKALAKATPDKATRRAINGDLLPASDAPHLLILNQLTLILADDISATYDDSHFISARAIRGSLFFYIGKGEEFADIEDEAELYAKAVAGIRIDRAKTGDKADGPFINVIEFDSTNKTQMKDAFLGAPKA